MLLTATAQAVRDMDWIKHHLAGIRPRLRHTGEEEEEEEGGRNEGEEEEEELARQGFNATVTDVTSSYSVLAVMGPMARRLMQAACHPTDDLSNEEFPFSHSKNVSIGYATVRATRISYVGELGYELLVPTELACTVYDTLFAASKRTEAEEGGKGGVELRNAGYYAIDSLRLEKVGNARAHTHTPRTRTNIPHVHTNTHTHTHTRARTHTRFTFEGL